MMKHVAIIGTFFSAIAGIYGMEIPEKNKKIMSSLFAAFDRRDYSSAQLLRERKIYEVAPCAITQSPIDIFANCPTDIQRCIINNIFMVVGSQKSMHITTNGIMIGETLTSHPKIFSHCLLEHLMRAKSQTPVVFGNKHIDYEDLILMGRKQQDNLMALIENSDEMFQQRPVWSTSSNEDFLAIQRILEAQPTHITTNLTVQVKNRVPYKFIAFVAGSPTLVSTGVMLACGLRDPVLLVSLGAGVPCFTILLISLIIKCSPSRSYVGV